MLSYLQALVILEVKSMKSYIVTFIDRIDCFGFIWKKLYIVNLPNCCTYLIITKVLKPLFLWNRPYNELMLLSCNKRNIYWLRNKIIFPKVAVWSKMLMLLKEGINNSPNDLSDITCKLFFFRVNYDLTALAFGISIFLLKTEMWGTFSLWAITR